MSKMPVYVIFGADGLLGSGMAQRLGRENNKHKVFAFPREIADISEPSQIIPLIEYVKPSFIINCAGINDQNECEELPINAFRVNGESLETLSVACKRFDAKLIHFSTSSVFDGKKEESKSYSEEDTVSPISIYGQSKALGESNITKNTDNHLIIRTGWPFHFQHINWVLEWLDALEAGEKIHTIGDMYGSPSYIPDIMDSVVRLIDLNKTGTYNVSNQGMASQYEMASYMGNLIRIKKANIKKIKLKSQTWWNAPISQNTSLSIDKYKTETNKGQRTWQEAMKHCMFSLERYYPETEDKQEE